MKSFLLAATVLMATAAPALAGSIDLGSLTLNGEASVASTTSGPTIALTQNNVPGTSGAAYLNTALALGSGANFNESFTFQIAAPSRGPTANGFAFFLSTNQPTTTGVGPSTSGNLGLQPSDTFAVEFYDFGNKTLNPPIGNGLYNSNLVAAIQDGNTSVVNNPIGSYNSPYGVQSCTGKTPGAGCMNNGDVWTADISYVAGKLTVMVQDGSDLVYTVISNYAIALGGGTNYYAGFSGSTGGSSDGVTIDSWTQDIPEPMTIGVFGAGLAALGMVRRRRLS